MPARRLASRATASSRHDTANGRPGSWRRGMAGFVDSPSRMNSCPDGPSPPMEVLPAGRQDRQFIKRRSLSVSGQEPGRLGENGFEIPPPPGPYSHRPSPWHAAQRTVQSELHKGGWPGLRSGLRPPPLTVCVRDPQSGGSPLVCRGSGSRPLFVRLRPTLCYKSSGMGTTAMSISDRLSAYLREFGANQPLTFHVQELEAAGDVSCHIVPFPRSPCPSAPHLSNPTPGPALPLSSGADPIPNGETEASRPL